MRLVLEELTKSYPSVGNVVNNISLEILGPGIVGLLGPNGAGKTTTIRMISGYLFPTKGKVFIDGLDVWENLTLAKRIIGYMPERLVLYPELSVEEFLLVRALIKGVSLKNIRKELNRVMELVDVGDVRKKLIGTLSKGYIQRVGLADALLGSPKLLILDEPTIGLDPNQILKFREVIRGISESSLVLFSTHILPEVEAICRDVIILHKGSLVAFGDRQQLIPSGRRLIIEVKLGSDLNEETWLKELGKLVMRIVEVKKLREGWIYLLLEMEEDEREGIFELIIRSKSKLRRMEWASVKLEQVFSALTTGEER